MSRVVTSGSPGGMSGAGNGGGKINHERRIPLPRPPVTTSSSSIGQPSDDDVDKKEVQSELAKAALNSIASLEDSPPMKGKSKSFANLSGEESNLKMKDLEKPDFQVNKKGRLMVAKALSRKNNRPSSDDQLI
ncbi:Hypothetical predicted protein [Olea europaea subsp. europaea]|uniref:Uncharacterized protein n=1 Tax=Olea europaea subsp. europaea TaxID=158383 RepID=A0A8S0T5X0_OLEEU|nr:Hypothetical predicted protein [Olea europaea subsp. europaea]